MEGRRRDGMLRPGARLLASLVANSFPIAVAILVVAYAAVLGQFRGPVSAAFSLGEALREFTSFSAVSGLVAMAVVELLKRMLGLRGFYQRRQVRQWFDDRAAGGEDPERAFEELLYRMTFADNVSERRSEEFRRRREERRLFNLPIEQVAAQVGEAGEAALLTGRGGYLVTSLAGVPRLVESLDGELEFQRIGQRMRAGVDALQISVGGRWRTYVRSTAVATSGGLGVLLSSNTAGHALVGRSALILAALVLGGALAWFFRDLWAVVERWRR